MFLKRFYIIGEYWSGFGIADDNVDSAALTHVTGLADKATADTMVVVEHVKNPSAITRAFMKQKSVENTLMERFENPDKYKVYNMQSKPRGLFYMINNVNFNKKQFVRTGSNIDRDALKKLFEDFGFDVVVDQDLNREAMKEGFARQVDKCMKTQYNCFAAAVLSHGKNGGPLGTDHELLETEEIMDMFNGQNCSGLSGKPKLFFIQACQGETHDQGAPVTDADVVTINEELIQKFTAVAITVKTEKTDDRIPTGADFFLAVATVAGYVSYRRTDQGSHFIQSMVKVFREYAATDSILNLMPKVNQEVQERWSQEKFFQVAKSANTMMKEFYFFPLSDFPAR